MSLTPSQEKASKAFANFLFEEDQQEFILAGPAGTGKTYLLQEFLKEFVQYFNFQKSLGDFPYSTYHTSLTATTNKAASVLSNVFLDRDVEGSIHSFLGIKPRWNHKTKSKKLGWRSLNHKRFENRINKSCFALVVIDEASMINSDLNKWVKMWMQENPSAKVLYVADAHQLPPVGARISPIFEENIPSAHLVEVVRQKSNTNLFNIVQDFRYGVENSDKILKPYPENDSTFTYYNPSVPEDVKKWYKQIHRAIPDSRTMGAQILVYTNARVSDYTNYLRKAWNLPDKPQPGEIVMCDSPVIADSGKLLCMGNTMVEVLEKFEDQIHDVPVELYKCKILSSFLAESTFRIVVPKIPSDLAAVKRSLMDQKRYAEYIDVDNGWGNLSFGQALTVHKSQGSTYSEVFLDVGNLNRCINLEDYRKLLYVGASRASQHLHILGTPK